MNIEKEREAFEEAWLLQHELKYFEFDPKDRQYFLKDSVTGTPDAEEAYHTINSGWSMWLKAKAHEAQKLEGCVVVPVRTDNEIIDQTIKLMDLLATSTNRFQRDPDCLFPFESNNPRVKEWWYVACQIQELLTNTDPTNCDFDEYKADVEAARGGK